MIIGTFDDAHEVKAGHWGPKGVNGHFERYHEL